MSRDIVEVMKRIRPLLATGGVNLAGFEDIERRLCFAAPELHKAYWLPLCQWLSATLPNPTATDAPDWLREVSDIIEARK